MARQSFKGDKRRRQLEKQRKQEEKRAKKQNKEPGTAEDDTSYLEYLSPGGPMDEHFLVSEEEDAEENNEDT